jgi:hypothetical protein
MNVHRISCSGRPTSASPSAGETRSVPRVERYSHPKQLTALSESLETMHLSGVCYGDKTLRDMPCTDMLSTYTLIGY